MIMGDSTDWESEADREEVKHLPILVIMILSRN